MRNEDEGVEIGDEGGAGCGVRRLDAALPLLRMLATEAGFGEPAAHVMVILNQVQQIQHSSGSGSCGTCISDGGSPDLSPVGAPQ